MDTLLPRLRNEHERSIRYFKEEIEEHGYGVIRELFEMFKQNPYLNEEYRYKLAILLSIARWEYQRETGKGPTKGGFYCGLCLYHEIQIKGSCQTKGVCILYEPDGLSSSCCKEYRDADEDDGEALIKLMRTRFHEKYYRRVT